MTWGLKGGGGALDTHEPSPSAFGSQVRAPCNTTVLSLGEGHLAALVLCALPVLNQEPLVMGGHGVWDHHKVALAPPPALMVWLSFTCPEEPLHRDPTDKTRIVLTIPIYFPDQHSRQSVTPGMSGGGGVFCYLPPTLAVGQWLSQRFG